MALSLADLWPFPPPRRPLLTRAGVTAAACLLCLTTPARADLGLAEAERLALEDDPEVGAIEAGAEALREAAVADGQLADPKLKVGIFNLPLDSLDLDQEPTTQLRFGLQQAFPRGRTLEHRQHRTEWRSRAEASRAEDARQRVTRAVRERFLDVYYAAGAGRIVGETRALFTQLVDITQDQYASGRVSQQDVIRASLELSRLDDRETRIQNQEETARAQLARWIGEAAWQPIQSGAPRLADTPEEAAISASLPRHPAVTALSARVEASRQAVAVAREQYRPGWSVGVEYRKRFGENPDGRERDDMMAAMVTVDLPLFTDKRQDRRLAASQRRAEAARQTRADRLRRLQAMLARESASWRRLGERVDLAQERLLREAAANAEASLLAYQSGVTEFTTLMRARITELEVRLNDLRVRVNRAKTQARLLYLAAEVSP